MWQDETVLGSTASFGETNIRQLNTRQRGRLFSRKASWYPPMGSEVVVTNSCGI